VREKYLNSFQLVVYNVLLIRTNKRKGKKKGKKRRKVYLSLHLCSVMLAPFKESINNFHLDSGPSRLIVFPFCMANAGNRQ
jgi:hypothetical protein